MKHAHIPGPCKKRRTQSIDVITAGARVHRGKIIIKKKKKMPISMIGLPLPRARFFLFYHHKKKKSATGLDSQLIKPPGPARPGTNSTTTSTQNFLPHRVLSFLPSFRFVCVCDGLMTRQQQVARPDRPQSPNAPIPRCLFVYFLLPSSALMATFVLVARAPSGPPVQ